MENKNNNVSSTAINPLAEYTDIVSQIEQVLKSDVQKLLAMTQKGIISSEQGQYLLKMLVNKANALNEFKAESNKDKAEKIEQNPESHQQENSQVELFNRENPDYFANDYRKELFNYLKDLNVDKDEISKIVELAQNLENSAVNNYLKKSAHDKNLKEENFIAKSKLTSYAQNSVPDANTFAKVFTRADIGKMSGDEFAQNEKMIYEQLKQGLIK